MTYQSQHRTKYPKLVTTTVTQSHSNSDLVKPSESNPRTAPTARISPTTDQLLHLIQYNTFRGLYNNKGILGTKAVSWTAGRSPEPFDVGFPAFSVVLPIAPGLPETLDPIEPQMTQAHSAWISTLPFPAMRGALIRNEMSFKHSEFISDIIGDLVEPHLFPSMPDLALGAPGPKSRLVVSGGEEDEGTTWRNGLIVWGEPYLVASWEATPGFLQKWAWALEGCEDLLEATNRWRRVRGEKPLRLSYAS